MNLTEFNLAATTNDLRREPEARGVADVVEFRMDTATDPLEQLAQYEGTLPLIATNRTRWFGGKASDSGRLDALSAASRFDAVEVVDVELETVRGMEWIVDEFRDNDVKLIISHHDFEETPDLDVLTAIFDQCASYGDVAKVATYPQDRSDTLRLLEAVNRATTDGLDVAGISMGELGSHTRVIAPLYGSKLGYAPLAADETEYAPGQIPLAKLATLIDVIRSDSNDVSLVGDLEKEFVEPEAARSG